MIKIFHFLKNIFFVDFFSIFDWIIVLTIILTFFVLDINIDTLYFYLFLAVYLSFKWHYRNDKN